MPAPTKKYRKSTKKTRRNLGKSISSTKERLKYFDDEDDRYDNNDKNDKKKDDENDEDEFCTIM